MPFSQSDLDALNNAIKSGVQRVTFADRTVEYRSLEDLRAAAQQVAAELNNAAGTPSTRQLRMYSYKGISGPRPGY